MMVTFERQSRVRKPSTLVRMEKKNLNLSVQLKLTQEVKFYYYYHQI